MKTPNNDQYSNMPFYQSSVSFSTFGDIAHLNVPPANPNDCLWSTDTNKYLCSVDPNKYPCSVDPNKYPCEAGFGERQQCADPYECHHKHCKNTHGHTGCFDHCMADGCFSQGMPGSAEKEFEKQRAQQPKAFFKPAKKFELLDLVPKIKKIIINNPATIIFFEDGSKSVVSASSLDSADDMKGIVCAILKRAFSTSSYNAIKELVGTEEDNKENAPLWLRNLVSSAYRPDEKKL